jgi:uncharacterized protein YbjT (DUF2867 family)
MKIKVIITGSTGMVGKGLLLECLNNEKVESVLIINRKPVGIVHDKLIEVLHKDMYDLSAIQDQLKYYDVCYFCLGVSALGLSEQEYKKITYDLTLSFAQTVLVTSPNITFCYVSGAGTDSTEKGNTMWARVKGKTENDLLSLGFKKTYMFRPGYIQPMNGIKSKTAAYNFIYTLTSPIYALLKKLPKYVTSTNQMSTAMINIALIKPDMSVLESKDINQFADID